MILSTENAEEGSVTPDKIATGTVVRSLEGIQGDVELVSGNNVTISSDSVGRRITISASVSGTTDLELPYYGSYSSSGTAFSVITTAMDSTAIAIQGSSSVSVGVKGEGSPGVSGWNPSNGDGVCGGSVSGNGISGNSGTGYGVFGQADASSGIGMRGISSNGNWGELGKSEYGVYGKSVHDPGTGVYGGAVNGNWGILGSPTYCGPTGPPLAWVWNIPGINALFGLFSNCESMNTRVSLG